MSDAAVKIRRGTSLLPHVDVSINGSIMDLADLFSCEGKVKSRAYCITV